MFSYIKGIVQEKTVLGHGAHRLVLECHGFGLELQVSQQTISNLPEVGEETQVHTVFVVKETEFVLFGFATEEEKELFALLTSISGIGPKLALALLSTSSPEQLSEAIVEGNERFITQAPGVGTKVAQRIILELKTKIEDWQEKNITNKTYAHMKGSKQDSAIDEEVKTILTGLGYSYSEIMHALANIRKQGNENDVEILVKESLKLLGTGSFAH